MAAAKKEPAEAKKEMTKSEVVASLAESTGLTKTDVVKVLGELNSLVEKNIGKRGPGAFTIPGLLKIKKYRRQKTKAREGINPRTGEKIMIPAKRERNDVKVRPLKALRDMV